MTTTDSAPPEHVVGCCHSASGQPICYEDNRDGDAIDCLMVGLEVGWLGSSCEPGRHLVAWPRGQGERYGDGWWSRIWTGDQWLRRSRHCGQTDAIWFAAAVFGTSCGKPRGLWHRHRGGFRFQLHITIRTALESDKFGLLLFIISDP